jgi:hypothetical protein
MRPNKDWLDNYKLLNFGFILIGKNDPCKVIKNNISKLNCLMVLLELCVILDIYQI